MLESYVRALTHPQVVGRMKVLHTYRAEVCSRHDQLQFRDTVGVERVRFLGRKTLEIELSTKSRRPNFNRSLTAFDKSRAR